MGALNFVMYGINVLFFLMGASMLGVGIWMAVDEDPLEAFAVAGLNEDLFWTSVYFMIGVGSFIIIVSCLGMLGAASPKKFKWALYAFIGIVGFVLLCELVMIIVTGIFWDSIDYGTETRMKEDLQKNYINETSTDPTSESWNNMQINWKCCGSTNYDDYDESSYPATYLQPVPWTCCVMHEGGSTLDRVVNVTACRMEAALSGEVLSESQFLHVKGCYQGLKDFLDEHSAIIIALTVTFAALEIIGVVLAVLLLRDD